MGLAPIFCLWDRFVSENRALERESWLRETLAGLGYELVDLESSRGGLLRVFIDSPKGITVEDCARVSRHLTRLFAVESVDFERLEVSSPGLDRPLKKQADFVRFAGEQAEFRLLSPVDNARRVKGVLRGCEDGVVRLETDKGLRTIALADIGRARLVPKIEWRNAR